MWEHRVAGEGFEVGELRRYRKSHRAALLPDYPQVDMLDVQYKSVNVKTSRAPQIGEPT
jgi:hypothetical protein